MSEKVKIEESIEWGYHSFVFTNIPPVWSHFDTIADVIEKSFEAINLMNMEWITKLYKLNNLFFEFNYDSDVGFFLQVTDKFRVLENFQYEIEKNTENFYRGKIDKNTIEIKRQQRKPIIEDIIGEQYDEENFNLDEWYDKADEMGLLEELQTVNKDDIKLLRQLANDIAGKFYLTKIDD